MHNLLKCNCNQGRIQNCDGNDGTFHIRRGNRNVLFREISQSKMVSEFKCIKIASKFLAGHLLETRVNLILSGSI